MKKLITLMIAVVIGVTIKMLSKPKKTTSQKDCPKCGGKGYYEARRSRSYASWLVTCNCK